VIETVNKTLVQVQEPIMVGGDPATWSPSSNATIEVPAIATETVVPEPLMVGGDPATWSPSTAT
jgi:hypothetical protein